MPLSINGIAASNGIAFGKAYKLLEPDLTFEERKISSPTFEKEKLHEAFQKSEAELLQIRSKIAQEQGEENAAIFDAHIFILHDPDFIAAIEEKIEKQFMNVESALDDVTNEFIQMFKQLDNQYMRERVADIEDVKKRILANLLGKSLPNPGLITEETILIANDLAPSETAQINRSYVKGFVTDSGGRTSHSAIIAQAMELPAIVGTKNASDIIEQDDFLIVDANEGIVHINPTEEQVEHYTELKEEYRQKKKLWSLLKDEPTKSKDGFQVKLTSNIGTTADIKNVLKYGSEGIGLYRTEALYMESAQFPSEEEQFETYKTVLKKMGNKPVVARTIDIGGDKQLPHWKLPNELNPFLGLRATRLALQEKDIFKIQLRALLRASKYGNLKIMFPMIATLEEFHQAKKVLLEEKKKLLDEGVKIADNIEVGMMVEIPSAVMLAKEFAKEVDFFSIGTNDLIQYTFAADRLNENVSYLYQPYHPAILAFIKLVIDAAHGEGKLVSMCGEMAGDPVAIPLLLGLGLDEFSMSSSSILQSRSLIRQLDKKEMEKIANEALTLPTAEAVEKLVRSQINLELYN